MKKVLFLIALVVLMSSAWAARVRVSHLAPLAPQIDMYLNGQLKFKNIPFRGVTDYLDIPEGRYELKAFPAGQTQNPILVAEGVTFGGGNYTITAAGRGDTKSYFPVVFSDEIIRSASQAEVRVINASPDLLSIDLAVRGSVEVVRNINFKNASSYLRFGAGSYNLEVRRSGLHTPMINISNLRLEAGKVYTLFVVGLLDDNTLNYILTVDQN